MLAAIRRAAFLPFPARHRGDKIAQLPTSNKGRIRLLARSDQPPPGWLKAITENMFNVVAGLTIITAVFYLAAITHILPLPESALTRLNGFASNVMGVLFDGGSWVLRLFD
jgi:hypothetical protein